MIPSFKSFLNRLFGKKGKGLGEDQLRRRLLSIQLYQRMLREEIATARKRKKARIHLYAKMETYTTEALKIESQLASMGPNRSLMHG